MTPRKQALLEAALMCSRHADSLSSMPAKRAAATCAARIEAMADSPLHFYPPGKRVIDLGQDSENSSDDFSGAY